MIALDPEFAANATLAEIRTQYERAQRAADLWDDKARALFLLLQQREEEAVLPPACTTTHHRRST